MPRSDRRDLGPDVPAPLDASAEHARARPHVVLPPAEKQPVEEGAQLGVTSLVRPRGRGPQRAVHTLPTLGARGRPAVLPHRSAAHRAQPSPFQFRPHTPMEQARDGQTTAL